jgi:hypothetical protein
LAKFVVIRTFRIHSTALLLDQIAGIVSTVSAEFAQSSFRKFRQRRCALAEAKEIECKFRLDESFARQVPAALSREVSDGARFA